MKQCKPFAVLLSLVVVSAARAQERIPIQPHRQVPGFLVPGMGSRTDEHLLLTADPTLPARLQGTIDRALAAVDSSVRHGLLVGVKMPGLGTWTGASGFSDATTPITPEMRMEVGSVSKTFTAATIFKLVEEGKLALDDSLGMWLSPHPNIDGAVTIRQLLNHSSGIYDFVNDDSTGMLSADAYFYHPEKRWTPEEILQTIGAPHFEPGTQTEYSNTNYLLLGMVIEKVSGNSAASEIRRRFLTPLGLTSTYLGWDEEIEGDLAHGWAPGLDPVDPSKQVDISSIPLTGGLSLANTAGGVVTTPGDLVTWADALYGGKVLDSASTKTMMTTRTTGLGQVGLGVFRWQYGSKLLYGHDGAILGYNSWMFTIPRDTVSVVILINSIHPDKDIGITAITTAILQEIYRKVAAVTDEGRGSAGMLLQQNSPNPFAGETSVRFTLPERGHVTLEVFDALGRRVAIPVDGLLSEGDHVATVRLDGSASGTYFYVLQTGAGREVKAMRLAR